MKKTLFYYTQLRDDRSRMLYRNILQSIREGKNEALAKNVHFSLDDVTKVYHAIQYDYPELFFVDFFGDGCYLTWQKNGDIKVEFRYIFNPEIQKAKRKENENFIQYIISHIPDNVCPSQYLTALWLHDLLVSNMRYDHAGREKKLREIYTVEGGISSKKAVCAGVARLYMMLCERLDIWCTYIVGDTHLDEEDKKTNAEGSSGRHAWNLLRLDGEYAYTDVTWDLQNDDSSGYISHTYFGMCDEQCSRTRKREYYFEGIQYPICSGPGYLNYYVREHCFFSNIKEVLSHIQKETTARKGHTEFMINPCGEAYEKLLEFIPQWISNYLHQAAGVRKWSWIKDHKMLVFHYRFEYVD